VGSTSLSRATRFRALGDGQIDSRRIFGEFAQYDCRGWAVLER
jgi:sugar phosphate isomerase/epimerase